MNFITNFFKNWFRNLLVLLALARFYPGFTIPGGLSAELLTSFGLTAINTFLQPFIKMLILPLNIITFGMFTWLLEAATLLILSWVISGVYFRPFIFGNFTFLGFLIKAGEINIVLSVIIGSMIYKFLQALFKYLTTG